jgi:hypothetical protein
MIGKKVYVFTNWGLVKAKVVEQKEHLGIMQYKVAVDINRQDKGKNYGFWFCKNQLHKYYFMAIVLELFKPFGWFVKSFFVKSEIAII